MRNNCNSREISGVKRELQRQNGLQAFREVEELPSPVAVIDDYVGGGI